MQPHPAQDDLLSAYLDGELDERERRAVEARLERDPAARALLGELRGASAALRALPRASAPPGIAEGVRARMERDSLLSDAPAAPGGPWLRVHRGLLRFSYAAVLLVTAGVAYLTLVQPAVRSTPAYESAAGRGRALTPMSPAIGGGEVARLADAGGRLLEKAGGELSAHSAGVAQRAGEKDLRHLGYLVDGQALAPSSPGIEAADDKAPALAADGGAGKLPDAAGEAYAMKQPPAAAAAEPSADAATPEGMAERLVAGDSTAGPVTADSLLAYSTKLSETGAANYSVMYISCDGPAARQRIVDEVSRQTRWLGLTELPIDMPTDQEGAAGFAVDALRNDFRIGQPAGGQALEICVSGPDSRLAALANNLVQAPAVTNARVEFVAEGKSAANLAESQQLAAEWTRNAATLEVARRGDEAVRLGAILKPTPTVVGPAAASGDADSAHGAGEAGAAAATPPLEDRDRAKGKAAADHRAGRTAPAEAEGPAIARSATRGGGAARAGDEGLEDDANEDGASAPGEKPARRVGRPGGAPPASRAARGQLDEHRKAAASRPREEAQPRIVPPPAGGAGDFGAGRPHEEGPAAPGESSGVGRPIAASQATQPALRHVLLIRIEAQAATAPTSAPAP